jgi:hypothetical protein
MPEVNPHPHTWTEIMGDMGQKVVWCHRCGSAEVRTMGITGKFEIIQSYEIGSPGYLGSTRDLK